MIHHQLVATQNFCDWPPAEALTCQVSMQNVRRMPVFSLYISPPLKRGKSLMPIWQHFQWQLDGSTTTWVWMMAISRVLHGRGITWRVVTTRSSKSSLQSLTGVFCSSAPRGFYHGVAVGKPVRFEWKGLASKNKAGKEMPPKAMRNLNELIDTSTIFETLRLESFSWNMLRNV